MPKFKFEFLDLDNAQDEFECNVTTQRKPRRAKHSDKDECEAPISLRDKIIRKYRRLLKSGEYDKFVAIYGKVLMASDHELNELAIHIGKLAKQQRATPKSTPKPDRDIGTDEDVSAFFRQQRLKEMQLEEIKTHVTRLSYAGNDVRMPKYRSTRRYRKAG